MIVFLKVNFSLSQLYSLTNYYLSQINYVDPQCLLLLESRPKLFKSDVLYMLNSSTRYKHASFLSSDKYCVILCNIV